MLIAKKTHIFQVSQNCSKYATETMLFIYMLNQYLVDLYTFITMKYNNFQTFSLYLVTLVKTHHYTDTWFFPWIQNRNLPLFLHSLKNKTKKTLKGKNCLQCTTIWQWHKTLEKFVGSYVARYHCVPCLLHALWSVQGHFLCTLSDNNTVEYQAWSQKVQWFTGYQMLPTHFHPCCSLHLGLQEQEHTTGVNMTLVLLWLVTVLCTH